MKLNTKSLSDVQLGTPLLAEGLYFARIRPESVKVEPTKDQKGQVLKLIFQVLNEEVRRFEDGSALQNQGARMNLWHNISLTETHNEDGSLRYDPSVRLKELGVAIGLPEDFEDLETTDLQGKCLKVKVKHRPAENTYPAKNEIAALLPIKDEDGFVEPAF